MALERHGRATAAGVVVFWAALLSLSLAHTLSLHDGQRERLALEQARGLFGLIETVRLWNAGHGGLYAPVTEATPPNQWLEVPDRDVEIAGRPYTMVNPAYMTRQIADLVRERGEVVFHITSLKPIRPANTADAWEERALHRFEQGAEEIIELTDYRGRPAYRYMSALTVEQPCLACHERQGYALGDVRGGISITIPAGLITAETGAARRQAVVQHVLAFLILSSLSVLFLNRLQRDWRALKAAKAEQEAMVAARTAELRAANAELERSNQQLEQFAYVASHDLQEPLRMIGSYAQLIDRRYAGRLDSEGQEFLGYITDGSRRMKAMVDALLAYSRVQRGELRRRPVAAAEAVAAALANLQRALAETGAEVTCGDLPTVSGDAALLATLFQNLIGNAVKYRHPERPPRITITARRDGAAGWRFAVADNGIGIPPEQAERIFRIFQRLHRPQDYAGTGIGLAISRTIVERHGGRIWVESDGAAGAVFRFTLPAAE